MKKEVPASAYIIIIFLIAITLAMAGIGITVGLIMIILGLGALSLNYRRYKFYKECLPESIIKECQPLHDVIVSNQRWAFIGVIVMLTGILTIVYSVSL